MNDRSPALWIFMSILVLMAQLIGAMMVTFVASLVVRAETFQQTLPVLFALLVALAFATGISLAGLLALRLRLLRGKSKTSTRLGGAVLGVCIPLAVALIVYGSLEPGNPFFLVSLLGGSLGFQAPGWVGAA